MEKKQVTISLWPRDYAFLVNFAILLGYGSGKKAKPGISRAITSIVRDSMTQTRNFSYETKMLLMEGSQKCCKGNVEEFVKLSSKEWIERN